MIFIAYDHDGFVIGIVNARNIELAAAYWHGADLIPHSIKTVEDVVNLRDHPTGVIPILKTKDVNVHSLYHQYSRPENNIVIVVEKI
jgi:hypothetical protein